MHVQTFQDSEILRYFFMIFWWINSMFSLFSVSKVQQTNEKKNANGPDKGQEIELKNRKAQ